MIKAIICLYLFLVANTSLAAVNYDWEPGKLLKAYISSKGINRIEFSCGIAEVIGDESKYQLIADKAGKNIFIVPKIKEGEVIRVSVIASSGQVQDMELVVKAISSQTIVISLPQLDKKELEAEKIAAMLRAMKMEVKGKYYVEEYKDYCLSCQKTSKNKRGNNRFNSLNGLNIYKRKTYQFGNLMGVIIEVRNVSNKEVNLDESQFKKIFAGTIAVSIEVQLLEKGQQTRVLVIARGSDDKA